MALLGVAAIRPRLHEHKFHFLLEIRGFLTDQREFVPKQIDVSPAKEQVFPPRGQKELARYNVIAGFRRAWHRAIRASLILELFAHTVGRKQRPERISHQRVSPVMRVRKGANPSRSGNMLNSLMSANSRNSRASATASCGISTFRTHPG